MWKMIEELRDEELIVLAAGLRDPGALSDLPKNKYGEPDLAVGYRRLADGSRYLARLCEAQKDRARDSAAAAADASLEEKRMFTMKVSRSEVRAMLVENDSLRLRVDELLRRNTELVEEVRAAKRAASGVVNYEYKSDFIHVGPGDDFSKIVRRMNELAGLDWETVHVKDAMRGDNGAPGVTLFCKRAVAPAVKEKS